MAEELVKVKAQLANVVSWEQEANQKVKDTRLELKKARKSSVKPTPLLSTRSSGLTRLKKSSKRWRLG